jgi:hypothetical protein
MITEEETLQESSSQAFPQGGIEEQVEEQQPEPAPIRPLSQAKADLEKHLLGFKAFVAELESTEGRLARAEAEEQEILEGGGETSSEEEQLEKLSRTLALKKVLERKLERGHESGLASAAGPAGGGGQRGHTLSVARSGGFTGQARRETPGHLEKTGWRE